MSAMVVTSGVQRGQVLARNRGGRPRDATVDDRVLPVVRAALDELGFDDVSVREVSVRCGVARATINRRWASKAELVMHALITDPDACGTAIGRPLVRAALPGLLSAAATDPQLRSELWTLLFDPPESAAVLTDAAARTAIAVGAVLVADILAPADDPAAAEIRLRIEDYLAAGTELGPNLGAQRRSASTNAKRLSGSE